MSAGRARVRLGEQEVADFLGSQVKVQCATNGAQGSPHLATMFYVLDEGRIAFWTYGASQKVRNLERDPRITCLVEDGTDYFELRGVAVTGRAELVRDPDRIRDLGGRVAARMVGVESLADLGDLGAAEVERQARKRIAIVVHPEKVVSWDHRKMLQSTEEEQS